MEKQRPPRYPRRLPVSFTNGKSKRSGTTSNLSPSGIFINSRRAFSSGTSLKMVLEPEETRGIALEGIVIWVSRTGGPACKNLNGNKTCLHPRGI